MNIALTTLCLVPAPSCSTPSASSPSPSPSDAPACLLFPPLTKLLRTPTPPPPACLPPSSNYCLALSQREVGGLVNLAVVALALGQLGGRSGAIGVFAPALVALDVGATRPVAAVLGVTTPPIDTCRAHPTLFIRHRHRTPEGLLHSCWWVR